MKTLTPREPNGQFVSWNEIADHKAQSHFTQGYSQGYDTGSQYDWDDAVKAVALLAVGAALLEGAKALYRKFK